MILRRQKKKIVLLIVSLLWLTFVSAGLKALSNYENTPGIAAEPPRQWPVESRIALKQDQSTLVMLAHPHCPCTRAAMSELASIMTHCQGRLTAYVLFLKPAGFSDDWEKTDLWQSAASIPGVIPVADDGGAEASRFHAATSGQTFLYDPNGNLLFSGGITAGRGHAGENAGENAVISLVNAGSAETDSTLVFGCPLFNPESECRTDVKKSSK
jgi:hypothetical protein